MSFDLFVYRWRNDKAAPYPRHIAEDIFDRGALAPSGLQHVEYPDGRGEIYCGRDGDDVDGFVLAHFGGPTICARALDIAHVTHSFVWPGDDVFIAVTDRATLVHLPPDMRADRTRVALVRGVDDLWTAIDATETRHDWVDLVSP